MPKARREDYLDALVFPGSSGQPGGKSQQKSDRENKENEEFPWSGALSLKGQEKPIDGGLAKLEQKKFTASFTIKLKDYPEIGVPKYLGITMANDIEVVVEGSL